MEYRAMCETDVCQIAEIEKMCFHDPWSQVSIASELENPLSYWLVAVDHGQVAGYVGSQTVLDGSDMMNIAVRPSFRRQGIAGNLIEKLIAGVKEKGAICLALEVRASNTPAIDLYKKFGFQQVGRRPNYYRNPREDALIMRKAWEK